MAYSKLVDAMTGDRNAPWWDKDGIHEMSGNGIVEWLCEPLPDADAQSRMGGLYRHVAERVAVIDRPIVYAGDCVVTIGVLAGLEQRDVQPTLVFFDAHGDFNTWETTPSGFIGGMPLAMLTGRGEQTIVEAAGLTPLPDERVILVDGGEGLGGDQALGKHPRGLNEAGAVEHSERLQGGGRVHPLADA